MLEGIDSVLLKFVVKSFNSSSFSVFRAKQKSDILFWKTTNNYEKKKLKI